MGVRIGEDAANSWLPFTGRDDLKEAVAAGTWSLLAAAGDRSRALR
jgi:hypothetical protein